MGKRSIIIAAGAAVLLLGIVLYFLAGDSVGLGGSKSFELEERLYDEGGKQGLENRGNFGEVLARTAETQETLLRDTKIFYRYPPRSRPLTKKMVDLIDPFSMRDGPHPLFDKEKPEPGTPPVYMYQFDTPNRSIFEKEKLIVTLRFWREPSKVRELPKILEASVHSDIQTGRIKVADASYNDKGNEGDKEAGDKILTFSWAAPYPGRLFWGEMNLRIKFQTPDGKVVTHSVDFHSTPKVPARFTGDYAEEIRNGSLVISPQLEVYQKGAYMVDANLFQADGDQPTHWVRSWAQLEPGLQRVELLFFGKIFHDKKAEGKFVLRQLRAYRQNEVDFDITKQISPQELERITNKTAARNEPRNQYLPLVPEYTTRSYSLSQFSDQEYEGPDKARRLKAVQAGTFQ